jgi:hypothetical protein
MLLYRYVCMDAGLTSYNHFHILLQTMPRSYQIRDYEGQQDNGKLRSIPRHVRTDELRPTYIQRYIGQPYAT